MGEWPHARERLVEHHPDAVPVARLGHRLARRLLRRHVSRSPDEVNAVEKSLRSEVRHEAEVEKDDSTPAVDEHVGRLDVSVQLAGAM
jgi:hypothetical protein